MYVSPIAYASPIVGGVAASHVVEVKEEQPSKANHPILVTLFGIVMEVRVEHSKNARIPIVVTLLPMVRAVFQSLFATAIL